MVQSSKKWSILILTLPARLRFLSRLLSLLAWQVQPHADIEVLIRSFDPAVGGYGDNVEVLRRSAHGDYISMIDDDDVVSGDYVFSIYPLLDGSVDYIGHRFRWSCDGELCRQSWIHSLKNEGPVRGDRDFVYRNISHLNPMKRELAMAVPFSGGLDADRRWAEGLRNLGIVKTEHFIDRALYHYVQISETRRERYFTSAVPTEIPF